jgi:hypothetical protein
MAESYRLEELGSLDFERLAHHVLARDRGLAKARWLGRADEGRVAVVPGGVALPELGAVPGPLLIVVAWSPLAAAGILIGRVRDAVREAGAEPRTVLLVTNTHDDANLRALLDRGPPCRLLSFGPSRLSAALDADAALRRRVPSVLGIRDSAGSAEAAVLDRSTADVDAARRLARVFVATRAYSRTVAVLERHRFAVVTGPPEMGKTAIARIRRARQAPGGLGSARVQPARGSVAAVRARPVAGVHRRRRVRLDGVPAGRGRAMGA